VMTVCYIMLMVFAVYDVGVADGVGGWRTYGVDPSQFPKSLMAACERMVHTGQFTPRRPVDVLSSGYNEIQQDKAPLIGITVMLRNKYLCVFTLPSRLYVSASIFCLFVGWLVCVLVGILTEL